MFWNYCGGVAASDVESFEAAGATEYRAAFRQDERLGLYVCVGSSTPGAVVERIRAPLAPRSIIQPVGVETDLDASDAELFLGDTSRGGSFEPYEEPATQSVLWYEMEYCNIADGGAIGFESFFIDYRYRGRSRSVQIPLDYAAMVEANGQCTGDVRARIDAEGRAWERETAPDIRDFGDLDRVGPLGLSPESVSRDLCRYLQGVIPYRDGQGQAANAEFEALGARAVFQVEDRVLAELLIDGAVLGVCPDFADRRDELVAMLL